MWHNSSRTHMGLGAFWKQKPGTAPGDDKPAAPVNRALFGVPFVFSGLCLLVSIYPLLRWLLRTIPTAYLDGSFRVQGHQTV